ncbi:MAG TPA: hypothetical protein DCP28_29490 [Cytophagales bacterium]|nr:hypothetical protein [Cytophagales bacterium]
MARTIFLIYLGIVPVLVLAETDSTSFSYADVLQEVEQRRTHLAQAYAEGSAEVRDSILWEAEAYLAAVLIESVFPAWYGTPWDFNGMTRTPGEGAIACGYFITNVLTDVGFRIPRIRWAQSASEVFIRELCPVVKRFSGRPLEEVQAHLLASGDGVYLVGLDNHTGFLTVALGEIRFVHADYYGWDTGVESEEIFGDNPLADSRYRVVGKLFSEEMVVKWLTGVAYE